MSYKIILSELSQKELQQRKRNERDGKILRRLMCIDMKHKEMRNKDIAKYCNVCIDTITDWLYLFNHGSFEALCSLHYEGRKISKLEKYKTAIEQKEKDDNIESLKELKQWIEKEYGVRTCISNLFYFCKKNSIFLTKKLD